MKIKQFFKGRTGSIILCIAEIVVGVLLLIDPMGFTAGIIQGAGVLTLLAGLFNIIWYFFVSPQVGAAKQLLFRGLVMAMGGLTAVLKYDWFISAFPLLTVLYAIAMLVLAAARVQKMADMKRADAPRWYLPGIAAAVTAVLAVVILMNPFGVVSAVWTFAGIAIIAVAAVDLAETLLT